jgi:hypothetical protein
MFPFLGCSTSPPENEIRSDIIKHFESRHYKVIDMDVSAIESVPQGERVYMGTEGYIVKIKSITLEPTTQNPQFRDSKGQRLIYKNGSIRVRKSTDRFQKWIITDIANIPAL